MLRRRCCKIFSVVYHLVACVVDRAAVRRVDRERVDVRVDDLRLRDLDRRERRAVWRVAESMAGSCDWMYVLYTVKVIGCLIALSCMVVRSVS